MSDATAIRIENDTIKIGNLTIVFQRTLRIPDDGRNYPLPASLGTFPICRVEDYADRVHASWLAHGGVFIPMYQREAAWLSFAGADWRPQALKIAVGMVNAISGEPWSEEIVAGEEQDYIVAPPQPWLDGINSGEGLVRQFVAMPLGMGYTVEGQVTGEERFGGIQLVAFEPKPGLFPEQRPARRGGSIRRGQQTNSYAETFGAVGVFCAGEAFCADSTPPPMASFESPVLASAGAEMGIAAGGQMEQAIYPDPHGPETWDSSKTTRVYVHIVNSLLYEQITGRKAPASPVSAQTYAQHGYPWYDLYDEHLGDVAPSDTLAGVQSVKEKDAEHGFTSQQDDSTVHVPAHLVKTATLPAAPKAKSAVGDDWSQ